MTPLLYDVDATLRPARMTICFPGRPNRFVTVRIRADVATLDDAAEAARRELAGFTTEQLLLLAECAQPAPVAPDPAPPAVMIEKVEQEERYPGPLYCPACCHKLGSGDSPAIAYLKRCPSCDRGLLIRFYPGAVSIALWTDA